MTELKLPNEIQQLMSSMMAGIERANQDRMIADAKVHPEKYRLSRIMTINSNYCYWHGGWIKLSNRLEHYRFCRSNFTNIGGQYLFWTEIERYTTGGKWKQTERVEWGYSDIKKDAQETIKRRRARWINDNKDKPGYSEYKPVRTPRPK